MKVLQRWRNSNSDGASDTRRSRNAAAASTTLSSPIRSDEKSRSRGGAAQQFYDNPQDILYPSNAASLSGVNGGAGTYSAAVSSAPLSLLDQPDSPTNRTLRQKSIKRGKVSKHATQPERLVKDDATSRRTATAVEDAHVRRRFNSLSNGRVAPELMNGDRAIKIANGTGGNGPPSWTNAVRTLSPQRKNAELPADLAAVPKTAGGEKAASREVDVPVFVLSQASPTTAPPQNGASTAQARSAPPSSSKFRMSNLVGSTSSRAVNGAASIPQTASPSDSHHHLNNSTSHDALRLLSSAEHRNAPGDSASFSTTSRSNNALQTPLHYDIGAVSPISSAPSSPDPATLPHSSSSKSAWEDSFERNGQMIRSTSTFSLRSARSRLSGVLGVWNRSSSGLNMAKGTYDSQVAPRNNASAAAPPTTGVTRSQTLAHELNELAVAFEEGLLGEEDYRLLRKGVFDKMVNQGAMEVPRESTLRSPPSGPLSPSGSQADDDSLHASGSILSRPSEKAEYMSLSRSRSLRSRNTNGASVQHGDRSMYSSAGSFGGQSRSRQEKQQILQEQYLQARRAKTLRGAVSMNTLDAPNDRASSSGVSAQNGGRGSSGASAFTGFSAGGLSISGGSALLARDYADKSSEQIQAEIAVVEVEGQRIVDNFKTLEVHAIGRYKLSFEQIRRAIANAGGGAESASKTPTFSVGPKSAPPSKAKADAMRVGNFFGRLRQDNGLKLGREQQLPSSPASLGSMRSAPAAMTRTPGTGSESVVWLSNNDEEDAEVRKLQRELQEIHRRRMEVTTKYEDRLAFLRSTMRSAKIREGLR